MAHIKPYFDHLTQKPGFVFVDEMGYLDGGFYPTLEEAQKARFDYAESLGWINPTLKNDSLKFPELFAAEVYPSNNPLGKWQLSLYDENGIIDVYHYDTEEEGLHDCLILERIFNVEG